MTSLVVAFLLAVALAVVHLLAGRLHVRRVVPRSIWLSAAGGVSVAYVFVHLIPEIATRQARVASAGQIAGVVDTLARERLLFVAALAGFTVFFGLERAARCSANSPGGETILGRLMSRTSKGVFWIHVGSFGIFNGLIGYLLVHREESGVVSLALYATAMGLHFVVNDYGIYEHHRDAYAGVGRWILAGAVLVGFLVGIVTELTHESVSLLMAFVAGGVVLNVIKEELPEDRESRFWAFLTGVVGYTVVLLLI